MTRSTTPTIKAVDDGTATDTTDGSPGPARPHGITRARQDQVYYLTGLASSALYEADHLVKNIQDASCAYRATRDDGMPAGPLDMTHVLAVPWTASTWPASTCRRSAPTSASARATTDPEPQCRA